MLGGILAAPLRGGGAGVAALPGWARARRHPHCAAAKEGRRLRTVGGAAVSLRGTLPARPGRQRARAVAVPVDAKMWVCRLGAGLLMPMFWGVEVGWCALRIGPSYSPHPHGTVDDSIMLLHPASFMGVACAVQPA